MLNRSPRHCSDERLLAYADGELPVWQSALVRRHLSLCWDCRARLHELEEQTQRLAKALREDTLCGFGRTDRAKARFLAHRDAFERSAPAAPARRPLARKGGVAAGAAAVVVLAGMWLNSHRSKPSAGQIIAQTVEAEAGLYRTPLLIHQIFRVRMKQLQPEVKERGGEIEIWSDASGRRFASRWRRSGGELRHAAWRTDTGREYLYNAAVAPGVIVDRSNPSSSVRSLGDLPVSSLDLDDLESGVIRWIETRQWRPISLSLDLNEFVSQDGATLRAERDGAKLCLQAERVAGPRRVAFSLEIDPVSHQPRLQRVRFEAAGKIVELELAAGECEFIETARLGSKVFEPDLPFVAARMPQPPRSPASPLSAEPQPALLAGSASAELEMEALYALHRVKACLGEPVAVVRSPFDSGQVEIQGLVETEIRRQELQAALAGLPSVKLSVRTAEEAIEESSRQAREAALEAPVQFESRRLPVQDRLDAFFAATSEEGSQIAAQQIAQLTTRAVSLSQGTLSHAWALRRLVERYGGREGVLPARSRWLLEVMIRDHAAGLETGNRRMTELLVPVLSPAHPRYPPATGQGEASEWNQASLDLFETANLIDQLVRALFAGADPPRDGAGEPSAAQLATDLLDAFQRLEKGYLALTAGIPDY